MRRAPPIPILFAVACVAARAAGLPTPVLSRLPPGYEVMAARQGPDVDAGRISYLIVLHRPADSASEPSPRPLVIVEQQADGTFRLAARNDEVVLRANEGGQCDPFDPQDADENGLAVKGRFFTVQNFVACGQHWSDYVTFRHDARTGRWLFANESAPSRSRSKASRNACARSGPIRESRWRSMHGAAATKRRLSGDRAVIERRLSGG
ncbi:lipoprotein [Burkholderia pseudomallei]|nr:lipoprotein [Burkholderia pseudomallei]